MLFRSSSVVVVIDLFGQPVSGSEGGRLRKHGSILVGPATATLSSAVTFLKASSRAVSQSFSIAAPGETLDPVVPDRMMAALCVVRLLRPSSWSRFRLWGLAAWWWCVCSSSSLLVDVRASS